jgi:hypothetical protein
LVPLKPDHPKYLVQKNGEEEVGRRISDKEIIRQFFNEIASGRELDSTSPSENDVFLLIRWESGLETLVRYHPGTSGSPSTLTFSKALLTASCADEEILVTHGISSAFAKRFETELSLVAKTQTKAPNIFMTKARCTSLGTTN